MDNLEKLTKGLTGIAGEYFVAGELSMRGFMASVTLRNNDSIDIHASKLSTVKNKNKIFAIQVKTNQTGKRSWPMAKKAETFEATNIFYIFVSLKGHLKRPEYFIVPSTDVASTVKSGHKRWLKKPGKKGQQHQDSNIRSFSDKEGKYLEQWKLLA